MESNTTTTTTSEEYTYNGKLNGNILIVGRTGCGKTTFIQQLGKNKLFGADITDAFWVSKIILSSEREDSIRNSFEDQDVHFSYPTDLDEFNYLISNFTQEKSSYSDEDEFLGENLKVNKLIVMEMFQVWQINLKIFQTF